MSKKKNINKVLDKILKGCCKNNRIDQAALYDMFFNKMYWFSLKYTKDENKAIEITNSGFLRVFQKIDLYKSTGSLEAWIRTIVYHSISDYYKKHSKYGEIILLEEHDQRIESAAIDNLYVEDIMRLVDFLPNASKKVFKLYALEGYSHKEIADVMSMSIGTSKWHLFMARKKLKLLLYQNNIVSKKA